MKNKLQNALLLTSLAAITLFFSVSYILVPEKSFSEEENRALQTAPRLTLSKLLDGTYTSQLHNYLSDQINFRTEMVEAKAIAELALGKRENNGVLLARNGYLIETCNYTEENYEYLQKNLAKIEKLLASFEQNGVSAKSVLIPRKIDLLEDELPQYYSTERNEYVWELVGEKHISLADALERAQRSGLQTFYKTDHHWTADGAYTAYVALGDTLGYTPHARNYFNEITLSDEFFGTTYSTSGFFFAGADTINAPSVAEDKYIVEIVDTNTVLDGVYDASYLEGKDKYATFLSGNNAHVRITLASGEKRETLLIVKDSYAHSLAPYLAEHYDLELIDPRYFTGSIESYIAENGITDVLFLFGLDTLASANISIR